MKEIRDLYDEIPYHIKDSAGVAYTFESLSHDRQFLFQEIYNMARLPDPLSNGVDLEEELTAIMAELENVIADIRY